jgi:UDP:flavonoid glycosyltransferase YjiC (YdhE family)
VTVEFLEAGAPPIFVGFGSMGGSDGERLTEIVTAAVRRAGVRAVVQAGWAGLAPSDEQILRIGEAPHEWLFARTAAVVHHAGAGTTGAGLRAGVPAIAVPVLLDQPFWAERLHRLGVAPPPLPQQDLTADNLAAAIRSCLDRPEHRRRAEDLAARIRAEDGPAAVLRLLEELDGTTRKNHRDGRR